MLAAHHASDLPVPEDDEDDEFGAGVTPASAPPAAQPTDAADALLARLVAAQAKREFAPKLAKMPSSGDRAMPTSKS